jgi:hypothetical protein
MSLSLRRRSLLLLIALIALSTASQNVAFAPPKPKPKPKPKPRPEPVLFLTAVEVFDEGEKHFFRYRYDVSNKYLYSPDMFVAAPSLPSCGENTNSSRTWVTIYDQPGNRLNSFCALGKPGDLGGIWFALEQDVIPPSWIYIELHDRATNTKYKSNLAATTP